MTRDEKRKAYFEAMASAVSELYGPIWIEEMIVAFDALHGHALVLAFDDLQTDLTNPPEKK